MVRENGRSAQNPIGGPEEDGIFEELWNFFTLL